MILTNPTATHKWPPRSRHPRPGRSSIMFTFMVIIFAANLGMYAPPTFATAALGESKVKISKIAREGVEEHGGGKSPVLLLEQLGGEGKDGQSGQNSRVNGGLLKDVAVPYGKPKEDSEDLEDSEEGVWLGDKEVEADTTKKEELSDGGVRGAFHARFLPPTTRSMAEMKDELEDYAMKVDKEDGKDKVHSNRSAEAKTETGLNGNSLFTIADDMNRLKEVSRQLRGGTRGGLADTDLAVMFSQVKDIAESYQGNMQSIQKRYQDKDNEDSMSSIKSIIGDTGTFVEASKEVKEISGEDFPHSFDINSGGDPFSLDGISDSQLAEFIQPKVFDQLVELSQDLVGVLEGIDVSIFTPIGGDTSQETSSQDELFNFDSDLFDSDPFANSQSSSFRSSGQSHPYSHDFFSSSTFNNILRSQKSGLGSRFSSPKLRKFASFLDDGMVSAKHELHLNALGDGVCQPECNETDLACNCGHLYSCVDNMTEYDLAVLIVGGYVDTNPMGNSFANFTVSTKDLHLFDADEGVGAKLERVKILARGDSVDMTSCKAVLEEFSSACNPLEKKCETANQQAFQVSIDQVCDAVNTPTKLLFEVIGDEFDGFTDEFADAECTPLSYNMCREFVTEFDRLYDGRDIGKYPLYNPMRKDPSITLHALTDNGLFDQVQFPVGYIFRRDERGVVTREFADPDVSMEQLFSLVNPSDGRALGVEGSCADRPNLELQEHDYSDLRQQFRVGNDGTLISKECPTKLLTSDSLECIEEISLVLMDAYDQVDRNLYQKQQWRFQNDGSIKNIRCPNSVISTFQDNSWKSNKEPVPFSILSQLNKHAMAVAEGGCRNGLNIVLQQSDPGDLSQQFYFGKDGEIFSVKCPGKVLDIDLGRTSSCKDGRNIHLWESNNGNNQKWRTTLNGELESVHCKDRMIAIEEGGGAGSNIILWEEYNSNDDQRWMFETSNLQSLDQLYGPFSIVNSANSMAITVRGCYDGLLELQPYTFRKSLQQFYLGDDGVIFSAHCKGKVVGVTGSSTMCPPFGGESEVQLQNRMNRDEQRWMFTPWSRKISSVACSRTGLSIGGGRGKVQGQAHDSLGLGKTLYGEENKLVSRNGAFTLILQSDGNLVIYKSTPTGWKATWATYTTTGVVVTMHPHDGNLVMRDALGKPLWSSDTHNRGCIVAKLTDTAQLVVLDDDGKTWADFGPKVTISPVVRLFQNDWDQQWDEKSNNVIQNLVRQTLTETRKPQLFSIVNPSNGRALGVGGSCADKPNIELQKHDRRDRRQQFHVRNDGTLISVECPSKLLTSDSLECIEEIDLVLMDAYDQVDRNLYQKQQWRFYSDGTIRNIRCPNSVISTFQDNSWKSNSEEAPFSILSQLNKHAMTVEEGDCRNGLNIVLQQSDPDDLSQQFYFGKDGEIFSVKCPGKVLDIYLGRTSSCKNGRNIHLWEFHNGDNQKWRTTLNGELKSVRCQDDTIAIKEGGGAGSDIISWPETDGNEQRWMFETSNLQSLDQLYGPFSIVNSANSMAISVIKCGTGSEPFELRPYTFGKSLQQFYLGGNGVIFSAECKGKVIGNGETNCGDGESSIQLQNRMNWDEQRWKIDNGQIRSVNCANSAISIVGGRRMEPGQDNAGSSIELRTSGDNDWDQQWDEKSNNVRLLGGSHNSQQTTWRAEFVEPNYDYALLPGFPGKIEDGCYSSRNDKQLAKDAMHSCDKSMSLLLGSQTSVGTLRAIAKLVEENGPEQMPGYCCMDNAANSQHFGYDYNPKSDNSTMNCLNHGPWHLGISPIACENGGGQWFRNPCIVLQDCIDARPINGTEEFSQAFENFAKQLVINDASDESQCGLAREELGFTTYYPYDTDVCQQFSEEMCDSNLFFLKINQITQGLNVNHTWTHITYESPEYPEDDELTFAELPERSPFLDPDNVDPQLEGLSNAVLSLKFVKLAVSEMYDTITSDADQACELLPESVEAPPCVRIPNPVRWTCEVASSTFVTVAFSLLVAADVALQVMTTASATFQLKDGELWDQYFYSKSTFDNFKVFDLWHNDALGTINKNIVTQHHEMREDLQTRHEEMGDCITCKIINGMNLLGCKMLEFDGGETCIVADIPNECRNTHCPQNNRLLNILWPKGQSNLSARLEQIKVKEGNTQDTMLDIQKALLVDTEGVGDKRVKRVRDIIGAHFSVDESDRKDTEDKVDAIKAEMKQMKDGMSKLNVQTKKLLEMMA